MLKKIRERVFVYLIHSKVCHSHLKIHRSLHISTLICIMHHFSSQCMTTWILTPSSATPSTIVNCNKSKQHSGSMNFLFNFLISSTILFINAFKAKHMMESRKQFVQNFINNIFFCTPHPTRADIKFNFQKKKICAIKRTQKFHLFPLSAFHCFLIASTRIFAKCQWS